MLNHMFSFFFSIFYLYIFLFKTWAIELHINIAPLLVNRTQDYLKLINNDNNNKY